MEISIIYEDDDILIVDKPSGIIVNRAETTRNEETVQDWAEKKIKYQISKIKDNGESDFYKRGDSSAAHIIENNNNRREETSQTFWDPVVEFYKRGGVVHRLDKETSGVLILAKNPEAFGLLQKQFKERMVKKTYVALTHGRIVPVEGEINIPVGRLPWNRMRFGVVPGGRESVTFYKVIAYYHDRNRKEYYSYVELLPKTGRTHQIRVHLKYLGYPIFSDFLYAGRKIAKKDRKILNRFFLHAVKISFIHPRTGEEVCFESKLPEELEVVLKQLKRID
ncbi:RluA family pseudouridine synthase [Patescibacteria group bacterium]|nr:RluA family pseudouridine synthase [Patescibacteria group bacterium]